MHDVGVLYLEQYSSATYIYSSNYGNLNFYANL